MVSCVSVHCGVIANTEGRWVVGLLTRMRMSFWQPSTELYGKSPLDAELAELPPDMRGEIKLRMKRIRDATGIVPGVQPSRGRVRCVEAHTERLWGYVFYAR